MNFQNAVIAPMTKPFALDISRWKYGGIYSFYDHRGENAEGYLDGTHYSCTRCGADETGELLGYYCFGEDARIPTEEEDAYDEGFLDFGLGLRPDLCGGGNGLAFLNAGLDYARNHLGAKRFRLSVAAFNERAVKVYAKAGFITEREVTNDYFKNKFYIMKL